MAAGNDVGAVTIEHCINERFILACSKDEIAILQKYLDQFKQAIKSDYHFSVLHQGDPREKLTLAHAWAYFQFLHQMHNGAIFFRRFYLADWAQPNKNIKDNKKLLQELEAQGLGEIYLQNAPQGADGQFKLKEPIVLVPSFPLRDTQALSEAENLKAIANSMITSEWPATALVEIGTQSILKSYWQLLSNGLLLRFPYKLKNMDGPPFAALYYWPGAKDRLLEAFNNI